MFVSSRTPLGPAANRGYRSALTRFTPQRAVRAHADPREDFPVSTLLRRAVQAALLARGGRGSPIPAPTLSRLRYRRSAGRRSTPRSSRLLPPRGGEPPRLPPLSRGRVARAASPPAVLKLDLAQRQGSRRRAPRVPRRPSRSASALRVGAPHVSLRALLSLSGHRARCPLDAFAGGCSARRHVRPHLLAHRHGRAPWTGLVSATALAHRPRPRAARRTAVRAAPLPRLPELLVTDDAHPLTTALSASRGRASSRSAITLSVGVGLAWPAAFHKPGWRRR